MGKLFQIGSIFGATKDSVVIGSNPLFRLIHFKNKRFTPIKSLRSTKCNFEVRKAGLKLTGDFSENFKHISVLSQEVLSINLVKGKEIINTFYLSPMHILSKIGLPNSVIRHFRFHPTEYKIRQTMIRIDAKEQQLELIASGYRFEKLLRSFKKMGYGNKLNIEKRPSIDLSDFKYSISDTKRRIF